MKQYSYIIIRAVKMIEILLFRASTRIIDAKRRKIKKKKKKKKKKKSGDRFSFYVSKQVQKQFFNVTRFERHSFAKDVMIFHIFSLLEARIQTR